VCPLRAKGLISWTKRWSPRTRHLHNVYELHGRWHPSHRRPLLRWLDRRRADHTKRTATTATRRRRRLEDHNVGGSQGWQDQRCGRETVRERERDDARLTEVQTQGAGAEPMLLIRFDGDGRVLDAAQAQTKMGSRMMSASSASTLEGRPGR
jgi:hypothetical protein